MRMISFSRAPAGAGERVDVVGDIGDFDRDMVDLLKAHHIFSLATAPRRLPPRVSKARASLNASMGA
jgi:hypothetical protein